jgi:hypothetical protein
VAQAIFPEADNDVSKNISRPTFAAGLSDEATPGAEAPEVSRTEIAAAATAIKTKSLVM